MKKIFLLVLVLLAFGSGGCASLAGGLIGNYIGTKLSIALYSRVYTPEVPDTRIVPPSSNLNLPPSVAGFSGAWSGRIECDGCSSPYDTTWWPQIRMHLLVVEEITSPKQAKVVYSDGKSIPPYAPHSVRAARMFRAIGEFQDGTLVVKGGDIQAVYRLNKDGTLNVEVSEPERAALKGTLQKTDLADFKKEEAAKTASRE